MYSFGGWNDISFVAGEVRDPNRNLPRALFLGLAIVTLVYLYVNWVLIANLGLSGLQQAKNAPAEMLQRQFETRGWGLGVRGFAAYWACWWVSPVWGPSMRC